MEKHVSKRLDECDNRKFEHGDDDDEGEEPTEAILRAICNKYSNGDEEAAVLKKERTDAWNSLYIVKEDPSSDFSESSMHDSKEKSGMIRKEEEAGGSNGMGVKMLRSFSRKEFVGATKPPLQGLRLRNNHQNSNPETAPVVGRPSPQTSDQPTIHTDDEIRFDNPSELMAAVPVDEIEEHRMPAMLQQTLSAVPISEENGPKGICSIFRNRQVVCTVVLLVIVSGSLTAGLFRPDDDSKQKSSAAPSVPQTAATSLLADLLRDSVEDTTPWENTTTPQYKALDWLANEDAWLARNVEDGNYSIPIRVLVERYALVVLSMAWGDRWWSEEFGMLDENRSSCEWNIELWCFEGNSFCAPTGAVCDEDGFVIGLSLCKFSSGFLAAETSQFATLRSPVAPVKGAGEIPTELLLLSSLEYLMLDNNELSGTVPSELAQLPKLEVLDLSDNFFTGPIPSEIGVAANLRKLNLGFNNIAGGLDSVVNPRLKYLDLSQNLLEGTIPEDFGTMTVLETLKLPNNKLSGTLPGTLGNLRLLKDLDLYGNLDLTGTVPATLSGLDVVWNVERTNVTNAQVLCSNSTTTYILVDCEGTSEGFSQCPCCKCK
eukprot:scaffold3467_cov118-Cylindrotheca_fusiformis.AAC.8